MRNITIIAFGILMLTLAAAKNPGDKTPDETRIQFNTKTWNDVLALAKKENKSIFLEISASWCGYCKRMRANVYTDTEVAQYYNSTFINISVDAEKGEGIELAKKYGVKHYPTFIFINSDGSLTKKTSGYRSPEKLLELGKSI